MKRYLSLTAKHHNKLVAQIADTIKEFYPIGISRESPEYEAYPGTIKLGEIIVDNIHNNKHFKERWGTFLKKLRKELKISTDDLLSTTYGVGPSFSADIILEKYEDKALVRIKKISFAVSLIGPYFTIYGVDETFIKAEFGGAYHAINVITTSPYMEFENDFKYLQQKIEKQFKDYQFVPISMSLTIVEGLHHDYLEAGKIHNALFNHLFDLYDTSFGRFRGDTLYRHGESNIKVTLTAPPPLD